MKASRSAREVGWGRTGLLALAVGAILSVCPTASARVHHRTASHYNVRWTLHRWNWRSAARPVSHSTGWGGATDPAKDAELIEDGRTGRVLFARNADAQRHPASLTKMMTLYLLFDALRKGQVNLNTPVYISPHAASQKPTKLGIPPGDSLPVDTAIRAAAVLSANDVAVAIAETLGGTESHFAELMTQKAHELGMRNTFYHNASGLPDDRQITTASDLGILARHLAYDFPQYFRYFSLPGFSFRGRVHLGHDNLLGRYAGADGIKTGYTNASGFNLVSSVVRGGAHIIGVVMGGYSAHRRDAEMMRILDTAFAQIEAQPQLVARAQVPWQTMAQAYDSAPVIAGFQMDRSPAPAPQAGMQPYAPVANKGEMDEDSAESRHDEDEIAKIITAAPPKPQVGAQRAPQNLPATNGQKNPPAPNVALLSAPAQVRFPDPKTTLNNAPAIPNVSPLPRDNAVPMTLASYQPKVPIPEIAPTPRGSLPSDGVSASPAHSLELLGKPAKTALNAAAGQGWTVQIGAFGDVPTARAQLAAYARNATDMLGHAERIIVPFTGSDGKIMFRARFGLFAEQEARSICVKLLERRQTCFPATLAR